MHLGCTLRLMLGQLSLSPQESLGRRHFAQMHNQAVALEAWRWEALATAAGVSSRC